MSVCLEVNVDSDDTGYDHDGGSQCVCLYECEKNALHFCEKKSENCQTSCK